MDACCCTWLHCHRRIQTPLGNWPVPNAKEAGNQSDSLAIPIGPPTLTASLPIREFVVPCGVPSPFECFILPTPFCPSKDTPILYISLQQPTAAAVQWFELPPTS